MQILCILTGAVVMSVFDFSLFLRDLRLEPALIVRGDGVYLYDDDGRRYLDGAEMIRSETA